jgi:hypothetical protein
VSIRASAAISSPTEGIHDLPQPGAASPPTLFIVHTTSGSIGDLAADVLARAQTLGRREVQMRAEIVSGHLFRHRKVENILRDPRVALSLEAPGANAVGMRNYAVVDGQGRITEGGAPELLQRLACIYVGPGVTFPPMPDPPPGYITRIRVERVTGQGLGLTTGRPEVSEIPDAMPHA